MKIRIGTRKSKLALTQTNLVIDQIEKYFSHIECEIVPITTTGDLITNIPLYDIGGKALFLREIEQQLIDRKIDIAVHSLKDVPGLIPKGLIIAAVLERNDPHDAFVSFKYDSIESLPLGAKIGSSSVRRKVFLRNIRPDLNVVIFRGNVDSRMNKLKCGEVDAIIVAAAGLKRLNIFNDKYCHILSRTQMLPAVGQGVISLEIREDNLEMKEICDKINHLSTWKLINAERAFLEYLNADCRTPLAAYASYTSDNNMRIEFMLSDLEGRNVIFHHENCNITASKQMAIKAAEAMSSRLNSK